MSNKQGILRVPLLPLVASPTEVSTALQDPMVANEMRALANVVAALNRQEATERTLRRFRGWETDISI